MARNMVRVGTIVGLALVVAACVTVNLYFPAAQVEKTAEEIVKDVYQKDGGSKKKPGDSSSLRRFLAWLEPREAHAADVTTVSNANIRAIKGAMRRRHSQLRPFYNAGRVGIARDGSLVLRDTKGLPLNRLAQLKRLINAENADRRRLYQEVAAALRLQPQQVGQVQSIFARTFRNEAEPGWWIQDDSGRWRRR